MREGERLLADGEELDLVVRAQDEADVPPERVARAWAT
jgi:hypothetical protein